MQYLYNSAINGQSYNIISKEQLFELLKSGIVNFGSTVYDMESQRVVIIDEIPEIEVWKIMQSNKRLNSRKKSKFFSGIMINLAEIKLRKAYIYSISATAIVVIVSAFMLGHQNFTGNGTKSSIKADTQNKEFLSAFAQIHKDYVNKSEPDKEAFNSKTYGENSVLLQKYATMVTKELQSEDQLRNLSSELQNQKLQTLLNTKDGFALFQAKVKNLSMVFERHIKERSASREEMQSTIKKTKIKDEDKQALMDNIGNTAGSFDQVYSDYCKNEVDLLNSLNAQMEYLKNNTAKYKLENNERLVFYNAKDLAEYSKIIEGLEIKIKKESEFINELDKMKGEILE